MKILMVCLGNICRSPLAEGILQHKANAKQLNWQIDSAGTSNYHVGEAPHHLSQKVATLNGINISQQQCRQFTKNDILNFDMIYVMDTNNYTDVKQIAAEFWEPNKVNLLLNELYTNENRNVPDPWGGIDADFLKVFKMIDEACEQIIIKYCNTSITHL